MAVDKKIDAEANWGHGAAKHSLEDPVKLGTTKTKKPYLPYDLTLENLKIAENQLHDLQTRIAVVFDKFVGQQRTPGRVSALKAELENEFVIARAHWKQNGQAPHWNLELKFPPGPWTDGQAPLPITTIAPGGPVADRLVDEGMVLSKVTVGVHASMAVDLKAIPYNGEDLPAFVYEAWTADIFTREAVSGPPPSR